ncbi:germin-like protein 9-3 [Miscanthus floridulus]|uniref:germin-like protein 9-3 n=1 Tax=Miscanthus floridulus TaxID=154761 RepID=UPI00345ADB57
MVRLSYTYTIVLVALSVSAPLAALAGDPDILTDYIVPADANAGAITGAFFTYTGFRAARNMTTPVPNFTAIKATMAEFPALNGQSVSYVLLMFPAGGSVNPTHTHPRAAELLLVVDGALSVGFVDTAGKLYTQDLAAGDMFVFPKGTVHWQFNQGDKPATALAALGSAAPGLVSLPSTLFGASNIDDNVLAKSFKTDVATIQKLKAGLAPPKK